MSKLKIFALGGLGEIGKNMYVVDINDKIFVFECGSTAPVSQVFGYDSIIPDFKYLLENIDRVQGVFISQFKQKYSGGFSRIIKELKVPYYASSFTIEAIKKRYLPHIPDDEKEGLEFKLLNRGDIVSFDDVQVECFTLTNSTPDTFGYALKFNAGTIEEPKIKNIVYLPDFDFDQNLWGHFRTDFKSLNRIADEGVFALLSPSTGADKIGHITTDGKLDLGLHKLMAHKGRTYILMDAENVSGMLQVIDAADFQKRYLTIIGAKARQLVELSMELGYSRKHEECYLHKQDLNDEYRNSENTVIIIAGEQTEEFFALQRIANYQDPHYILTPNDNVIILIDTPKKYEKVQATTWDNIWFDNANLIEFDKKLMPEPMCGSEDIKLLYSLLSPEYIIPINGDYRMLKAQATIALNYGIDEEHIINLENGVFACFEDNKYVKTHESIETGDILFGEESDSDINDYVAREREALTQEGFLVVSGMINLKDRKRYGDIEIVSSGFLPEFGQDDAIKIIKEEFNAIVDEHLANKKVDYKELRSDLKNALSKRILKETKKRPILIPVVIDISSISAKTTE